MTTRPRVFAGVLVRRRIAAECGAALLAGAQVKPLRADLDALRAFAALRLFNRGDRVEMRAAAVRHNLFSLPRTNAI